MNKDWHANNRMPKNATMEQRIRWQEEHARVYGCRPLQASVRAVIERSQTASPPPTRPT
jgi:hypothetical protein